MDTQRNTAMASFVYHRMPTPVSRKDFNRYIDPHRQRPNPGPKPKLSLYKIFNYMLYGLPTGIQWDQLQTQRHELHYTNVYKWHKRWSTDGSYHPLLKASLRQWHHTAQLATAVLHGDGSNPVVKKGASASASRGISPRKVQKHGRS